MNSFFDEMLALDRPFIEFDMKLNGHTKKASVRRLSAEQQDAVEAFQADTYAKHILLKTEQQDGKESELEQVAHLYALRPREEVLDQLLGSRTQEIQSRAWQLMPISAADVRTNLDAIEDEAERKSLDADYTVEYTKALESAKEEVSSEYTEKTDEELVNIISQVNVNVKAQRESRYESDMLKLFYALHDTEGKQVFSTIPDIKRLNQDTIDDLLQQVEYTLLVGVPKDLPFVSQPDQGPAGQLPSQKNSAAATKVGGRRTKTIPNASK